MSQTGGLEEGSAAGLALVGLCSPHGAHLVADDVLGVGGAVGVGGADDLSALSAERMDIGAALGNLGGDPAAFFQSSAEWQGLYKTLFLGLPTQPVDLMYGALASLSGGRKQVCTAVQVDEVQVEECMHGQGV